MADGRGCTCAARSENDCCCDVDWTPQKVIDQQAEIERMRTALTNIQQNYTRKGYIKRMCLMGLIRSQNSNECSDIENTQNGNSVNDSTQNVNVSEYPLKERSLEHDTQSGQDCTQNGNSASTRQHICTPDIWNEATEQHLCGECGKRV